MHIGKLNLSREEMKRQKIDYSVLVSKKGDVTLVSLKEILRAIVSYLFSPWLPDITKSKRKKQEKETKKPKSYKFIASKYRT